MFLVEVAADRDDVSRRRVATRHAELERAAGAATTATTRTNAPRHLNTSTHHPSKHNFGGTFPFE